MGRDKKRKARRKREDYYQSSDESFDSGEEERLQFSDSDEEKEPDDEEDVDWKSIVVVRKEDMEAARDRFLSLLLRGDTPLPRTYGKLVKFLKKNRDLRSVERSIDPKVAMILLARFGLVRISEDFTIYNWDHTVLSNREKVEHTIDNFNVKLPLDVEKAIRRVARFLESYEPTTVRQEILDEQLKPLCEVTMEVRVAPIVDSLVLHDVIEMDLDIDDLDRTEYHSKLPLSFNAQRMRALLETDGPSSSSRLLKQMIFCLLLVIMILPGVLRFLPAA
mmetsp:Transcript_35336/g.99611  ORF Transcript_35336/g.99611 Transcript_35336/m.99611 type:complete len:277 (+) Transcript_35336:187-1017(+)|eukprot:CAMPEP_0119124420 /NCGR_PEP_ID=MMETSP1310-20130426/4047_1 /TAXON_ID=464262 /ORGANISM="Genus nov. species nov., Strain RCC2339" /LENGTH=276 /DNA_ID=CAMNT_0007114371 /DNA_START=188 /DNA_END=1018 /DNA_ORIENTATION=-